jgi:hypothetical protein
VKDFDSMSSYALSRYAERVLGYTIDEKTIRNRRAQGLHGEALLRKPRVTCPKGEAQARYREKRRFNSSLSRMLSAWKPPGS